MRFGSDPACPLVCVQVGVPGQACRWRCDDRLFNVNKETLGVARGGDPRSSIGNGSDRLRSVQDLPSRRTPLARQTVNLSEHYWVLRVATEPPGSLSESCSFRDVAISTSRPFQPFGPDSLLGWERAIDRAEKSPPALSAPRFVEVAFGFERGQGKPHRESCEVTQDFPVKSRTLGAKPRKRRRSNAKSSKHWALADEVTQEFAQVTQKFTEVTPSRREATDSVGEATLGRGETPQKTAQAPD